MTEKLKLMTIAGTRPELIKLSAIIKKCDRYFEHTLVHTGQNYDYRLNGIFFSELGLRAPDEYLAVAGKDLGETMGNILARSYEVMARRKPDALLVLGDTNSCLSVISAKRLKIPVFHLEAGNRCFDENLPEEINRRIIDHTSDVNLCYTEHARRCLLAEGVRGEHAFVVGSPMAEVLSEHSEMIGKSDVLARLGLAPGGYFLLSAHREENIDNEKNFRSLMTAVNELAEETGLPVIYSTHPRSRKRLEASGFMLHPLVRSLEPFGFFDYNRLQRDACCVVSDSGTLSEEAAYAGFAAVSLRTSTERPEGLDKGCFVIGSITGGDVLRAVRLAVEMKKNGETASSVPDYAEENVSMKVVRLIQSYTPIINRMVWRKEIQ